MIDYRKLGDAQQYFSSTGYRPVDAPWVVSEEAHNTTAPDWAVRYPLADEGLLVASGEQSFLQLILHNGLKPGRWQCTTPCFRGDKLDALHRRYFMKLELIDTVSPTDDSMLTTLELCRMFFSRFVRCKIVMTAPSSSLDIGQCYDIVTTDGGIELGSYGIREAAGVGKWLYATGCAEPRLSYAIARKDTA